MQCQVGWPAAALERWQGLHKDLHATTQALARLAGRPPRWSGDGVAESCRGLADVPGKNLVGGFVDVLDKDLARHFILWP